MYILNTTIYFYKFRVKSIYYIMYVLNIKCININIMNKYLKLKCMQLFFLKML